MCRCGAAVMVRATGLESAIFCLGTYQREFDSLLRTPSVRMGSLRSVLLNLRLRSFDSYAIDWSAFCNLADSLIPRLLLSKCRGFGELYSSCATPLSPLPRGSLPYRIHKWIVAQR
jgi:hypothetical protein